MFSLIYGCAEYLFVKSEFSVAVIGLNGCGKTTLCESLKTYFTESEPKDPKKIVPTIGLNVFRIELSKIQLRLWDLSGDVGMRKIWHPNYTTSADGIIFCVDISRESLSEAKDLFDEFVNLGILKDIPLLLVATKTDQIKEDSLIFTPSDLYSYFEIDKYIPDLITSIKVCQSACPNTKDGGGKQMRDSLLWLEDYLKINTVISRSATDNNS